MIPLTHVHGPGKRWEGTRYTCTECRDDAAAMQRFAQAITGSFLSLAEVTPILSVSDLPLIGEFPPARVRYHSINKYGDIPLRPRRYRRIR